MSYEIKIQCSLHEEMWKIRALLLIASLFLHEIMAKGEGKPGIRQGIIKICLFHRFILRTLLSLVHYTGCLCRCRHEVAAVFWSVQPDWEDLPQSPGLYQ